MALHSREKLPSAVTKLPLHSRGSQLPGCLAPGDQNGHTWKADTDSIEATVPRSPQALSFHNEVSPPSEGARFFSGAASSRNQSSPFQK